MSARDRALQAVNKRLKRLGETELRRRTLQQPALYDGRNRVRSLGAVGGVPARATNSTGGLAVGQPVSVAQGILAGLPDAPNRADLEAVVAQLLALLGEIRNERGIQVFEGDPNDSDDPAFQQFNEQLLYRADNGEVFYWKAGTAAEAGNWEILGIIEEQNGLISDPAAQSYTVIYDASYRCQVVELRAPATTTATLSVANNGFLEAGQNLILTVSETDGAPWPFTIVLRRA